VSLARDLPPEPSGARSAAEGAGNSLTPEGNGPAGSGSIGRVSATSGQVPKGLQLTFVVLTAVALAVVAAAAVRGVWFVVVIAGLMVAANLYILWIMRRQPTSPS